MVSVVRRLNRRGVLRVVAFLGALNLAITALYLPRARAQVEALATSRGLAVLKQLGPFGDAGEQGVDINGQRMFLAARSTQLPVAEVLALFERDCHEQASTIRTELAKLSSEHLDLPAELRDPTRWLTLKQENGAESGQVTCFTRAGRSESLSGFVTRLSAFAKTGELSQLGDARYVVARRDEKANRTQVLALWTEGRFNVLDMFPSHGDAPGRDSSVVPRPPESVRVLSADISERPYALRMYDSAQPPQQILGYYAEAMKARGWSSLDLPRTSELDLNEFARTFQKDGRAVIVVVGTTPEQKSGVNLIEMGNPGFARAELLP